MNKYQQIALNFCIGVCIAYLGSSIGLLNAFLVYLGFMLVGLLFYRDCNKVKYTLGFLSVYVYILMLLK